MADFVLKRKGKVAAYFAIHAFSQLWMYPYGYANTPAPNAAQLVRKSHLCDLVNLIGKFVGKTVNTCCKCYPICKWPDFQKGIHC